jgi:tetratricopeptide (TPR) repeat protein
MGVLYKILPWFQLGENLLGNTKDPLKLIGSGMNEDQMLEEFGGDPNHTVLIVAIHQARMVLLYLLGAHEAAEADRIKYDSYKGEMSTYVLKFYAYFFKGLNCLALARTGQRVRYYKRQATRYRKELEKYAKAGCVNAVPMLALMSAEFYALGSSREKALDEYDKAITISSRSGFRMFTGVAYECRGKFLLENGNAEEGTESLQQAFNEFLWYGAKAKTLQMMQKYSIFMNFSQEAEKQHSKSSAKFQPFLLKEWQQREAERRNSDMSLHVGPR